MAEPLPVVRGALDLLMLKALSPGPMHGVEMIAWLEERSGGELDCDDSAIYQGLYRMEKRRLVSADWGVTENNRRARYYKLTTAGRTYLKTETDRLLRSTRLIESILLPSTG